MLRSLLLPLMFLPFALFAQDPDPQLARAGWDPLPDSLFLIWDLDADQVRRLKVIEEDHDAELAKLMADATLPETAREERLRKLAMQRREEVRSVIGRRLTEDWTVRMRAR